MPLPNSSFEPETHRWRPGAVAPSREVPSQNCAVFGQKQPFFAQNGPQTRAKHPKRRETVARLHVQLDFAVSKSPLVPFNSTICPRNGPKRHQKAPKSAHVHLHPKTKHGPYLGLRGSKSDCEGTYSTRNPPTFCGFQASNSPNETPRHLCLWSLGTAGGQPGPRMVGANGGPTRVLGAKKIIFSKVVPRPLGMLKQVFLGRFETVVACFGPWKIPKSLEHGPFRDQKWIKNGSKTHFSKSDPGPFGMLKQVVLVHFEPVVTPFGPGKNGKCLEKGPFWDQKWVKNGSKMRFSKSDLGPFGMLKQVS